MSKRSCINCRYLTDGIYCKARSERITSSNWFEYGCPHFEKRQQTVFDHITESMEALADKMVYAVHYGGLYFWHSTLIYPAFPFETREKAITATVEELKKEYNKNELI